MRRVQGEIHLSAGVRMPRDGAVPVDGGFHKNQTLVRDVQRQGRPHRRPQDSGVRGAFPGQGRGIRDARQDIVIHKGVVIRQGHPT